MSQKDTEGGTEPVTVNLIPVVRGIWNLIAPKLRRLRRSKPKEKKP